MFLKTLHSLRHTLALRLTLWYAGIFAVSSMLAFALAYALMASIVRERTDEDLLEDIEDMPIRLAQENTMNSTRRQGRTLPVGDT